MDVFARRCLIVDAQAEGVVAAAAAHRAVAFAVHLDVVGQAFGFDADECPARGFLVARHAHGPGFRVEEGVGSLIGAVGEPLVGADDGAEACRGEERLCLVALDADEADALAADEVAELLTLEIDGGRLRAADCEGALACLVPTVLGFVDVPHFECASLEGDVRQRHVESLLRGRGIPDDGGDTVVSHRCHALENIAADVDLATVGRHHAVEPEGVVERFGRTAVAVDEAQFVAHEEAGVDVLCPTDVGEVGTGQHAGQRVEEGHRRLSLFDRSVGLVLGRSVGRILRQQHLGLVVAQRVEGCTHGVELARIVGAIGVARQEVEGQAFLLGTVAQRLVPPVEGARGAAHLDVAVALDDGRSGSFVDVEVVVERAGEEPVLQVGLVPDFDVTVGVFLRTPLAREPLVNSRPRVVVGRRVHESGPLVGTALQDGRRVAVGDDERGCVLLGQRQQIVNVGHGVGGTLGGAEHAGLPIQVVLATGHLVAHGACLEVLQLREVAVKPILVDQWRLIDTDFLYQRIFFPL